MNLVERHGISAGAISAIDLALPGANAAMVNRPTTPRLRAATLGSGQYVMAVTALRGMIDLQSFEEDFLNSQEVHALMKKVTITSDSELGRHFPKYWSGRVTIKMTDGQTYSEQILAPKGEPENPMTEEDVEEKFRSLARPVLGEEKTATALRTMASLDGNDSVRPLLTALSLR